MSDKVQELVSFILERYLWQFHSRTWDREENINGILNQASELLSGKEVSLETPKERCFYADAKFFVNEIQEKFLWLGDMDDSKKRELIKGVKEKLIDVTITNSLNGEVANANINQKKTCLRVRI